MALLVLGVPAVVSADHCGAVGSITPVSGPPGTTFVFRTNLGAPSDLRIHRNERLVREVYLAGDADVRYRIRTGPGDAGTWRARAEVRGFPDCITELTFVVVGAPDTSIRSVGATAAPRIQTGAALITLAALVTFIAVIGWPRRRLRASSPRSSSRDW
jgi:hypothetical protein